MHLENENNIFIRRKILTSFPILQCTTADPDGRKRALVIGGGIADFTDVAATFSGVIQALKEKVRNHHKS